MKQQAFIATATVIAVAIFTTLATVIFTHGTL
jgi:hypothetical protein